MNDTVNDTVNDTLNDTLNDTVNDTLNDTLNDTVNDIMKNASLICGLISVLLVSSSAHAYYVEYRSTDEAGDPVPVRYVADEGASLEVAYRLNPDSFPEGVDGVEAALHAAFDAWSSVECSTLAYVAGAPSDLMVNSHWRYDDGEIYVLVFFSDDPSEWTAGPSVGHFFWAHDGTGALIGGTVVLNSKDHAWATDGDEDAMDVQSIATALIGRAMGITSNIEDNSTFGRYRPGDVERRMLGEDDVDGLTYLYGDESCEAPPPVEACDGTRRTGDDACPPRPTTSGGPGTRPPAGTDSGPPPMDAGPGGYDGALVDAAGPTDRDVPENDGGCSASGGASGAWLLLLAMLRRRDPRV